MSNSFWIALAGLLQNSAYASDPPEVLAVSPGLEFRFSAGLGQRSVTDIHKGAISYLRDRGLLAQSPDLRERIGKAREQSIPFLTADFGITPKGLLPIGCAEFRTSFVYIPPYDRKRNSGDDFDVRYSGEDAGEAHVSWRYGHRGYGKLGVGSVVSPIALGNDQFEFRYGAGVSGGVSRIKGAVNTQLDLRDNEYVQTVGIAYVERVMGVETQVYSQTNVLGTGFFGCVSMDTSVRFGPVIFTTASEECRENIRVRVTEVNTSSIGEVDVIEGESKLYLSGSVIRGSVGVAL